MTSVDKSNDRVRKMFSSIASKYDRMNHLLSMNVDKYWRWMTVRRVRPSGKEPILDVCTGTGDLALAYWKKTQGSTSIIAADFCREMLDVGERKKRKISKSIKRKQGDVQKQCDVTFIEADTQELPFEDDRFQIVSVAFGLRNVADTIRGLSEMTRVCSPGGKVAVLEFSMPSWQPFKAIYGWYFRRVLPKVGQWFARNNDAAYSYLPESVSEFPYGEALAEKMRHVGLRDVIFYPLTMGIATLYVGTK